MGILRLILEGLDVYYVLRKPNRIISDSSSERMWGKNPNPTHNVFQSNFYITGRIWEERIQKSSEKALKSC